MNELTIEAVSKIVGSNVVALALFGGIESTELFQLFAREFPGESREQTTVRKMNAIGSLRSMGYQITGGRGGGTKYLITKFEKPVNIPITWDAESLRILSWFDELPPVLPSSDEHVASSLRTRSTDDLRHENTWLYAWCYELVGQKSNRATGRWIGANGIIKRTFVDRPRFSIIDLSLEPDYIEYLIHALSCASVAPVKVINIQESSKSALEKTLQTLGHFEYVEQPIYDLDALASTPEIFFSSQSYKTARKMLREVEWSLLDPLVDSSAAIPVVDLWRKIREGSQARPATLRDYVAVESKSPRKLSFIGYWQGKAVSYRVMESLANNPQVAADIVEKSINQSAWGGHSGISDASLIFAARSLVERGIHRMNGGESASVGPLLTRFKHKYQIGSSRSITFVADKLEHKR